MERDRRQPAVAVEEAHDAPVCDGTRYRACDNLEQAIVIRGRLGKGTEGLREHVQPLAEGDIRT